MISEFTGPSSSTRATAGVIAVAIVILATWALSQQQLIARAARRVLVASIYVPKTLSSDSLPARQRTIGIASPRSRNALSAVALRPAIPTTALSVDPAAAAAAPFHPDAVPLDLGSDVMRAAVAAGSIGAGDSAAGPVNGYSDRSLEKRLAKRIADSTIPSCLSTDAFKFDPPTVGPATLVGVPHNGIDVRALFLARAAVVGHCK
jgi:hypothetical protein